jgi:hypothetical protein
MVLRGNVAAGEDSLLEEDAHSVVMRYAERADHVVPSVWYIICGEGERRNESVSHDLYNPNSRHLN